MKWMYKEAQHLVEGDTIDIGGVVCTVLDSRYKPKEEERWLLSAIAEGPHSYLIQLDVHETQRFYKPE